MSLGHGVSIIRSGLVMHLDAANIKSYSGSGTTWKDLSGNGNDMSMVGTVSYSSGVFTFTATTSNYFIKNPFSHPTSASTIEIWCLSNSGISGDALWSYALNGDDNHHLLFDQSNLSIYLPAGPGAGTSTSINVADGLWKQIVKTSNRSTGAEALYVNGTSRFTGTISAGTNFTSGGSLVIGQEQDSVGGSFDINQAFEGKYAVFRMYNRVLSASEVNQNFNALRGRYGI